MKKAIICVFVALAFVSLGLTLIPAVFSQPENIKVLNYTYYIDSAGYLDVVGEVQNIGSNTVDPVALTGKVYAADGTTTMSESYCYVWVKYLSSEQKAPFYMEFYPQTTSTWDLSTISTISLTVAIANATSGYQYPDLKITSSSGKIGTTGDYNGAYLVNGVIENTGTQTATNITVVATFYNSTGSVVAVGNTYGSSESYVTASLAPSQTVSFQVPAYDLNQSAIPSRMKISSYSLLLQAQGPILQGTAPIVTPYQSSSSSSSTSTTSSPSPTADNSNNAFNPAIIVVVVVIVILAIAGTLVALRKSKPHMTVKEAKKARKKSMG